MSKTRRERILAVTDDLVTDFLYYDRKECSYLPMNEIEEAILNNEITIEEIIDKFSEELRKGLK